MIWVRMAPLLVGRPSDAACARPRCPLPGGCAIGTRPVDLLIMARRSSAPTSHRPALCDSQGTTNGLRGRRDTISPKGTVSGTHVALMAATRKGTKVSPMRLRPEIADRRRLPPTRWVRDNRPAGAPRIVVEGVDRLHGARHTRVHGSHRARQPMR